MIRFASLALPMTALALTAALITPAFAQADLDKSSKPEAKKKDKEPKSNEPPWRRYGRGGGGGPMGGANPTEGILEFLNSELDLDSDQQAKVKKILNASMQNMFKRMGEFFGGGGQGDALQNARKAMEEVRVDIAGKINKVLTPSQRKEFEALVDQFDRRAQKFEQGRRAAEDPTELLNPKPMSKRIMLGKAERALFLGPEETAVIMPYIEKVMNTRLALYESKKVRRRDLLNAIDGGANDQEVKQRVADIRTAEQFQALEMVSSQQALRELLTIEQEARFVAMGILD